MYTTNENVQNMIGQNRILWHMAESTAAQTSCHHLTLTDAVQVNFCFIEFLVHHNDKTNVTIH